MNFNFYSGKDRFLLCACWYLKYPLSYRMLVEMIEERGLNLTRTTIMRWIHQYSPPINEKVRKHLKGATAVAIALFYITKYVGVLVIYAGFGYYKRIIFMHILNRVSNAFKSILVVINSCLPLGSNSTYSYRFIR